MNIQIHFFQFSENLEAIEKGQAGLHYSKKKSPDSSPCTPLRAEATPTKAEYSPLVKNEYSQIKIEKYHPNIRIEKSEPQTPTKAEYSPSVQRDFTPMRHDYLSSPIPKVHQQMKMDSSDMYLDSSLVFNSDTLTDLVLQVSLFFLSYRFNT